MCWHFCSTLPVFNTQHTMQFSSHQLKLGISQVLQNNMNREMLRTNGVLLGPMEIIEELVNCVEMPTRSAVWLLWQLQKGQFSGFILANNFPNRIQSNGARFSLHASSRSYRTAAAKSGWKTILNTFSFADFFSIMTICVGPTSVHAMNWKHTIRHCLAQMEMLSIISLLFASIVDLFLIASQKRGLCFVVVVAAASVFFTWRLPFRHHAFIVVVQHSLYCYR